MVGIFMERAAAEYAGDGEDDLFRSFYCSGKIIEGKGRCVVCCGELEGALNRRGDVVPRLPESGRGGNAITAPARSLGGR